MGKELPASKWLNSFFHGFSQVVFMENNISGALIVAAYIVFAAEVHNWNIAIIPILATIIGNITAKLLGNDDDAIAAGLFGFCPVLVGTAAAVFFAGTESYIVGIVGSIIAIPITTMINKVCARFNVPGFTMPFVATAWLLVLVSYATGLLTATGYLGGGPRAGALIASGAITSVTTGSLEWVNVLTKGIGEIWLLDSVWASLLMFLAFAVDKWHWAIKVAGVILVTIAIGLIFRVDGASLNAGLYTYNALLVFLGLETFSKYRGDGAFSKSPKYWALAIFGLLFVCLIDYALPAVLAPFGLMSLTFPFVFTGWALLWVEQHWGTN
jgi:urea transporter